MDKKPYQAPAVTKVRLVVKNAVLGNCHASPNLDPKSGPVPCSPLTGCYNPA